VVLVGASGLVALEPTLEDVVAPPPPEVVAPLDPSAEAVGLGSSGEVALCCPLAGGAGDGALPEPVWVVVVPDGSGSGEVVMLVPVLVAVPVSVVAPSSPDWTAEPPTVADPTALDRPWAAGLGGSLRDEFCGR